MQRCGRGRAAPDGQPQRRQKVNALHDLVHLSTGIEKGEAKPRKKAKQSKAKQSKAKQSKAKQSKWQNRNPAEPPEESEGGVAPPVGRHDTRKNSQARWPANANPQAKPKWPPQGVALPCRAGAAAEPTWPCLTPKLSELASTDAPHGSSLLPRATYGRAQREARGSTIIATSATSVLPPSQPVEMRRGRDAKARRRRAAVGVSPVPVQMSAPVSPVPAQMWQG
jgi:hypothetical protein